MKENLNKDESTIGAIIRPTTSSIIHTTIRKVTAKILIDFPPAAYKNPTESVYTIMNSLIMKYNEQLGGFVISYENLVKLDDSGYIFEDSPYVHFFVQADWTIWSAPNGSKLIGKVVGQSNNHIGLLVLDIFNVKIPYTNMPNEIFEWDGQNDLVEKLLTIENIQLELVTTQQTIGSWIDKRTADQPHALHSINLDNTTCQNYAFNHHPIHPSINEKGKRCGGLTSDSDSQDTTNLDPCSIGISDDDTRYSLYATSRDTLQQILENSKPSYRYFSPSHYSY
ncbi:10530_t:CDS:2, partial [Entrophospora sp. SA101]